MSIESTSRSQREKWCRAYREARPLYKEFVMLLRHLLVQVLRQQHIDFEAVEARAKTVESFAEKLTRDGKSYKDPLQEITDFAGLRVILFHIEDVSNVCATIESLFDIDAKRSVDKKTTYADDQFGYLSVHKIARIKEDRAALPEWVPYRDLYAEIQIRTVLQHGWAVISHKIHYKREADIPGQFRRRLMRLAGIFELADEEFAALVHQQVAVKQEVTKQVAENDLNVPIDAVSMHAYFKQSPLVAQIKQIAEEAGFSPSDQSEEVSELIAMFQRLNVHKLKDADVLIRQLLPLAPDFFNTVLTGDQKQQEPQPRWAAKASDLVEMLIIGTHGSAFPEKILVSEFDWTPAMIARIRSSALQNKAKIVGDSSSNGKTAARRRNANNSTKG